MRYCIEGILVMALGCLTGCERVAPPASVDLPIYFTCDTDGRIEPCGCSKGQYGGLTRLKSELDSEAAQGAMRVDVGNAVKGHEDYDLIEYRYILRAYAATGYDAMNMGQHEAQFTLEQLRGIQSPVPLVSANLLDKATGKPVFHSSIIVERGGFQIGVIGVLDPRGFQPGEGLAVGDMAEAISKSLEELRGKTDLIVLLAFTDEETLAELARQFFECQVILGGKVSQPAQQLVRENRSIIYYVTNESRAVGMLYLNVSRDLPPQVASNEIRLLKESVPEDETIRALAQEYRDEVRKTHLALDDPNHLEADMVPGVRTVATYVGSEQCVSCHQSSAEVWHGSAHSRAFATLVNAKADADPNCIGCHTVGFGDPSGYRRPMGTGTLVNVGCESCHGPGSLHVRQEKGDRTVNFTFHPLDAGDCQKCHYGEYSRPFDWDQFWPIVKHGKVSR
jgi:hypothetical protein